MKDFTLSIAMLRKAILKERKFAWYFLRSILSRCAFIFGEAGRMLSAGLSLTSLWQTRKATNAPLTAKEEGRGQ
jgi:hypothetical protein